MYSLILKTTRHRCILAARRQYNFLVATPSFTFCSSGFCQQKQLFSTTQSTIHDESKNHSTTTANGNTTTSQQEQQEHNSFSNNNNTKTDLASIRNEILKAALKEVHQHGWTNDALAAATMTVKKEIMTTIGNSSMSVMGIMTVTDLIGFCMDQWNIQLKEDLMKVRHAQHDDTTNGNIDNQTDPLEMGIKMRLEYLIPYLQSNRWHEGMALGMRGPTNAEQTRRQLQDMMEIIVASAPPTIRDRLGYPEKLTLGAVYVATELHMLTDTSPGYQDTWAFLASRMQDWRQLTTGWSSFGINAGSTGPSSSSAGDALFVATSVASSLVGGLISLVMNPTTNQFGLPEHVWKALFQNNATTIYQQQQQQSNSQTRSYGTHPSHYDPPNRS